MNQNQAEDIRLLEWPECVKQRAGLYIGTSAGEEGNNPNVLTRELINNAQDESYLDRSCNMIFIDLDFGGYQVVADNGRGIRIDMSPDKPDQTMADLAISSLHSGSKFNKSETGASLTGMNGLGLSVTNALSSSFVLMSKITESNWDKSIPAVADLWTKNIKSKKDLFYVVVYEFGYKKYEGALKRAQLESFLQIPTLPNGMSTIVLFKPDPAVFDNVKSTLPTDNLMYFLLIQEKIYRKKVHVIANGSELSVIDQIPFRFSALRTIIPANRSMNPQVTIMAFWDVDEQLGERKTLGSVNGLAVNQGHHIQIFEECYQQALIEEFKISHKFLLNGLKMCVIVLASETIFDSQTKTKLKSIAKVRVSDFSDLVRDIRKTMRQNFDFWQAHVDRLNYLANSMKNLSAAEKAEGMKAAGRGSSAKLRAELGNKLVDALAPDSDRWKTELFVVEGDSAGGSLVKGRKSCLYHAVLPLRGRVINTTKMEGDKMLDNKEMYTLFKAIGLGLDCNNILEGVQTREEALEVLKKRARYSKIIISTDADADGSIIASGLLYTFHKFARFMIDLGMVYLIESPNFSQNGQYFFPSDPTHPGTEIPLGLDPKKPFSRYKGLGSLNPNEVYDAFFDPNTRRLIQVTLDGSDYASSLVDDIEQRKLLLTSKGILSNPFNV